MLSGMGVGVGAGVGIAVGKGRETFTSGRVGGVLVSLFVKGSLGWVRRGCSRSLGRENFRWNWADGRRREYAGRARRYKRDWRVRDDPGRGAWRVGWSRRGAWRVGRSRRGRSGECRAGCRQREDAGGDQDRRSHRSPVGREIVDLLPG